MANRKFYVIILLKMKTAINLKLKVINYDPIDLFIITVHNNVQNNNCDKIRNK